MKSSKTIALGTPILIHAYYRREEDFNRNREWKRREYPIPRNGFLVGYRRLANGKMEYTDDDYGWPYLEATSHLDAALIVMNLHDNPIYVPVDAIEVRPV